MGFYVGYQMSDHLSAVETGKKTKPTSYKVKKKAARKRASASRRRNR